MKKVIFCLQTMTLGGIEKELLAILKYFPKDEYKITILIFYSSEKSIEKKFIDLGIDIINIDASENYFCSSAIRIIKNRLKRGKVFEAIKLSIMYIFKNEYMATLISLDKFKKLEQEYDFAVCYHMHSPILVKYVATEIKAKFKYIWMHNDFSGTGYQPKKLKKYLIKYDKIIGCSQKVSDEFVERCPLLKDKTMKILNIIDEQEIIELSKQEICEKEFDFSSPRLLTIARYSSQKGYFDAINACKILVDSGIEFKWYAVGWGNLRDKMSTRIKELNLQEYFILLGKKDNPYPYLANTDIYVQPSRHEGFGLTIAEAKTFKKPIVCTDFAGAREQLLNNENATIVSVGDSKAIAEAILQLLKDEKLRQTYIKNLERINYDNSIKKLMAIF